MTRKFLFFVCITISFTASSQTLFTYGKYKVDAKDFLKAYNKNNSQAPVDKQKAMREYLDLYINSRLKIREAFEQSFDTLPQIKNEVDNLRTQIVDNYMSDPDVAVRLVKEAFQRSQKDVHLAHIFIAFPASTGIVDTTSARARLDDITRKLQKGDDFLDVAQQNSDDLAAKTNKGDVGYITVFTLPYELENVVYNTPVGKYSAPIRSKAGYHIFKVLDTRNAYGKIKAQQILLAIPPNADDKMKNEIAVRADSIYKRLKEGDDLGTLAKTFSNDYISAANNGTMPDIGVGQFEPAFENVLWGLEKDGEISKPFYTSHGWHILKRISRKPVITDPNDKANEIDIQQKVSQDGRWKVSKNFIYERVTQKAGFQKFKYTDAQLFAYTDSVLDGKVLHIATAMNNQTPIFKIGDSISRVSQFLSFAQAYRYKADGSGIRPYNEVLQDFIHTTMYNYYREHLELFNEDFKNQMTEFLEGNMFFEIMQREVWNKAQADSLALVKLYNSNKAKYKWKPSADAVIFYCSNPAVAQTVHDLIQKDPASWKKTAESYNETVALDSGRYEYDQIPNLDKNSPQPGALTRPLISNDNTSSFAYVIKIYPQEMQRNFTDAKGVVINDYQELLEKQWTERLRKKYPVKIDEKVFASISK